LRGATGIFCGRGNCIFSEMGPGERSTGVRVISHTFGAALKSHSRQSRPGWRREWIGNDIDHSAAASNGAVIWG
jgi:hypothetical protein